MAHKQPHIQKILEDRYYLRDEQGRLLENDPEDIFARVATAISKAEKEDSRDFWKEEFFELMNQNKFLPNTPTLINAGKKTPGCFSACFTIPVDDSMDGIFQAVKNASIIMKAGGGVGFNFGRLREKGAIVKTTGHHSSGPVSFMQVFDSACDTISQGGVRRGAMIGILPVSHPDIEEFITMKDDGFSFSNFNISVGIDDLFMKAVKDDGFYNLVSPIGEVVKVIAAKSLWEKIVKHAWKTGDPGLVFLDTINREHPLDDKIEATNPCGELPLRDYESCNLGSINLMEYLNGDGFDWTKLEEDIPKMVRFLDDVIDMNPFPLPEIDKASKESRKIGLGLMGWADALISMKIPYNSDKAIELADKLGKFLYKIADAASIKLGEEKGKYPLYDPMKEMPARRNATLLCVAPTGTLSRVAGVSGGIEPVFSWRIHHKLTDLEYTETHWAYEPIKEEEKSYQEDNVRVSRPDYMITANEIPWEWHLSHQITFQKWVDNSISKTINLPTESTEEDIEKAYFKAWKSGLKGITVYRDKCKANQPLNKIEGTKKSYDEILTEANDVVKTHKKRGPVTVGVTHKIDTGKGKLYITVNYNEYHNDPVEVFIRLGHTSTSNENALAEWTGRLISVMFKYGIPIDTIIKQGNKVFSDSMFWYNQKSFQSLPQLISYLLKFTFPEAMDMAELDIYSMLDVGEGEQLLLEEVIEETGEFCYNCGTYGMIGESGCKVCSNCGYEKCS